MIRFHVGFDLSFSSTGITFYIVSETNQGTNNFIEFHRLVRDKSTVPLIPNVNQYKYDSNLFQIELDLKHNECLEFNNGTEYSNKQTELSELCYIVSDNLMNITHSVIKKYLTKFDLNFNQVELYVNFEGSILSGFSFNTQIGLNMLQGIMRYRFIQYKLKQKFHKFKLRIITPTILKSFFTYDGKAQKIDMVKSFINNYSGNRLIPLISTDKKIIDNINDIVDSFALVAFDVYDLSVPDNEKILFTQNKSSKTLKTKSRKPSKLKESQNNLEDIKSNLPDNLKIMLD